MANWLNTNLNSSSSLMNVFDVTGSGMTAKTTWLNTAASNLANADSVSSSEKNTYRARMPVFAAVMEEARHNAYTHGTDAVPVKVLGIVEKAAPLKMEYNPGHPMANDKGYIFKPNVNVMEEMTNVMFASRGYQVDADAANTAKDLALRTLMLTV